MDSSVDCPSLLSFSDLLVAIRDVMPETTITAFEYEDEVGDRITVRSDEELKAMLSYVSIVLFNMTLCWTPKPPVYLTRLPNPQFT
nr:dual specificity mitogen-activated protein kinase kinase 5-like [Salvelinus alpinus]